MKDHPFEENIKHSAHQIFSGLSTIIYNPHANQHKWHQFKKEINIIQGTKLSKAISFLLGVTFLLLILVALEKSVDHNNVIETNVNLETNFDGHVEATKTVWIMTFPFTHSGCRFFFFSISFWSNKLNLLWIHRTINRRVYSLNIWCNWFTYLTLTFRIISWASNRFVQLCFVIHYSYGEINY